MNVSLDDAGFACARFADHQYFVQSFFLRLRTKKKKKRREAVIWLACEVRTYHVSRSGATPPCQRWNMKWAWSHTFAIA